VNNLNELKPPLPVISLAPHARLSPVPVPPIADLSQVDMSPALTLETFGGTMDPEQLMLQVQLLASVTLRLQSMVRAALLRIKKLEAER